MIESPHPDPDALAAFAGGVIAAHERRDLLIHFAECRTCRECLDFIADAAVPVAKGTGSGYFRAFAGRAAAALFACAVLMTAWQLRHARFLSERNPPSAYNVNGNRYDFKHVRLFSLGQAVPLRFNSVSVLPLNLKPQTNQIVVNSQHGERWITFKRPWGQIDTKGTEPAGTAN